MTRRKHKTSKAYRNKARKLLAPAGYMCQTIWGTAFTMALVDIANSSRWEK